MLFGKRSKKVIDGGALRVRALEWNSRNHVIGDHQPAVGRDHINVVVLQLRHLLHLSNWHGCASGKDARELAAKLRVEVNDHNERRVRIVRERLKKSL